MLCSGKMSHCWYPNYALHSQPKMREKAEKVSLSYQVEKIGRIFLKRNTFNWFKCHLKISVTVLKISSYMATCFVVSDLS